MEKACTTILVGKDASLDNATLIARNDDTFLPLTPQRFIVQPAYHDEDKTWRSNQNNFVAKLPKNGMRTTFTPNADVEHNGYFGETSINEKNVALSATESVYGNPNALAYDPWVKDGLAEDSLQNLVAPYITSARQGVQYLGALIKKYGSPEGNGVLFSDSDEVWYMEIVTGHHWAATKIPDDCYAVAANQVAQQTIDFNDADNYQWSEGLQEFVASHHLNPSVDGEFNFRKIFGTDTQKDRHYNTPRVWYAHKCLGEEVGNPESSELPFIRKASKKISVKDVQQVLGSHYNETQFDPLGQGSDEDKLRYRPIGLNRTQNAHVLQIRSDVDESVAAIMWMCFGMPSFAPFVPFYANAEQTDERWANTPLEYDFNSAYWLYRTLSMLVESHHAHFIQKDVDFLTSSYQNALMLLKKYDRAASQSSDVVATLTDANHQIAEFFRKQTEALIGQLVMQGLTLSQLTFDMDKNL